MQPKILYGKPVAESIYSKCKKQNGKELSIITVGNDDASAVYVRNKIKACERVGLIGRQYRFKPKIYKGISDLAWDIRDIIQDMNISKDVAGIMIQQPYPDGLSKFNLENDIYPEKDVDGLGMQNFGLTCTGREPTHYPATPAGIIELLKFYKYDVSGEHIVILGRSKIVGKPLAAMLDSLGATVSVCHSKTRRAVRKSLMHSADIIISAVGKAKIWKAEDIGDNLPVLIDVGMNRDENGKLCGDFDIVNIGEKCFAYTPVPGGVGLTTVAMLIYNCTHNE